MFGRRLALGPAVALGAYAAVAGPVLSAIEPSPMGSGETRFHRRKPGTFKQKARAEAKRLRRRVRRHG